MGRRLSSPLQTLLAAMQEKWEAGDMDGAAKLAAMAAPYQHGRCAAARDISGSDLQHLSDAELARLVDFCNEEGGE